MFEIGFALFVLVGKILMIMIFISLWKEGRVYEHQKADEWADEGSRDCAV